MTDKTDDTALSARARLAREIRRRRDAYGLSQPQLAQQIGYTRQYVSMAEGPAKNLPSEDLIRALDVALAAQGDLRSLRDEAKREQRALRSQFGPVIAAPPHDDVVRSAIPRIRQALAACDLPPDGPVRTLPQLRAVVDRITEQRVEARYTQIVDQLPELLLELGRLLDRSSGKEWVAASRLLTLAYRAADGVAFKFGYLDLSARIVEMMRQTAEQSGDALLLASVAYVRTEVFFATKDLDSAARALTRASDDVPLRGRAPVSAYAARGPLHMRAAVVAARAGQGDTARDHLTEAHHFAAQVPEGVYYGTAFGPTSVRIHAVAVAVELGDSPTAVQLGRDWDPPKTIPAERRSHYYIDLATAHREVGRPDDAFTALRHARHIAPQHTREHPRVRQTLTALRSARVSKSAELDDFAAWARLR